MKLEKINNKINKIKLDLLNIKLKNSFNNKNKLNNCDIISSNKDEPNNNRNKYGFPINLK